MRGPQSHGKFRGTIFTSFKRPFLNDPRGVAGPTGLCSTNVLDSCSLHNAMLSYAPRQMWIFQASLIALCARGAAVWVALNVRSRSFPDQKRTRAGSGLAGRR